MLQMPDDKYESWEKKKCYISQEEFVNKEFDISRVRDYCCFIKKYIGTANRTCKLKKVVPRTIYMRNGSIYYYHFKPMSV